MHLNVLFFGATADITGQRRVEVAIAPETTASEVSQNVIAEYPRLASHKIHISLNQQYATGDEIVCDGDELAIFTAVSGG
ncbi:molybdopterin converting factor subunit 1 [soil metagenome]